MSAPFHRHAAATVKRVTTDVERASDTAQIPAAEIRCDQPGLSGDMRQILTGVPDPLKGGISMADGTVSDTRKQAGERFTKVVRPWVDADDKCRVCGCVGGCDDRCPAESGEVER